MTSAEVKAEYTSSLMDLTFNSKPMINVLTMLAEENVQHAADIVEAIETHLSKVSTDVKLPILYLIDCIVKNVNGSYTTLFSQNIVSTFCNVFKLVDEKVRGEMFKLRQTWTDVFPPKKLYALDVQIRSVDPAWPVTAPAPNSIYFNPKFLKTNTNAKPLKAENPAVPEPDETERLRMRQQLIEKQKELIELEKKKLELELLQTQVKLEAQNTNSRLSPKTNMLLKPEVARQLEPMGAKNNLQNKDKPFMVNNRPTGPKINPVNCALVQASKPAIRDPRLLRQQPKITPPAESNTKCVIKSGLPRPEPRLLANKDDSLPPQKLDTKSSSKTHKSRSDKSKSRSSGSKNSESDKSKSGSTSSLDSPSKKRSKSRKEERKRSKDKETKQESPTGFKGAKNTKNRNYVRRNRSPSFSPEPEIFAPPEKQAKIDSEDKCGMASEKDVDLRLMPGKKRSSSDLDLPSSKKNKTQVFDVLFGNEDIDLRKLKEVERPPTPPPPIISSGDKKEEIVTISDSPKKSFEEIRAKLANATGRDKIMAKSYHKKRLEESRMENDKIIISQADEQGIKDGTLTKEQEKQLLNKIVMHVETSKLREAQKRDEENIVSDEEENGEEYKRKDRDERMQFKYTAKRGDWRGGRRRHWDNPPPRPGVRPWVHQGGKNWRGGYSQPMHEDERNSPDVDLVVESVDQDDNKTIDIDRIPRTIRYYGDTAVVFMSFDDPREISFQDGVRRVTFNDTETFTLSFNEGYMDFLIGGSPQKVKLGSPCREIYINGKPYECYFGGPGITIELGGKNTTVKLEGPPPQVKIGSEKRTDLCAGKVNLIINAKVIVPVFLDAKVQRFVLDTETHTLRFVDSLKTVLINDVPFKVEFGGLPKPITIHDKKHFIRFTVLPAGVRPGHVKIRDMEQMGNVSPKCDENSQDSVASGEGNSVSIRRFGENSPDRNSKSPTAFNNLLQQQSINNLDMLSSVMATINSTPSSAGYQVENIPPQLPQAPPAPVPQLPPSLNINELFHKLVASGIVTTASNTTTLDIPKVAPPPVQEQPQPQPQSQPQPSVRKPPPPVEIPKPYRRSPLENLRPVTFKRPETLKVRQSTLYSVLYTGMQCSSCGMRFPPEQSIFYSQHLDWHFRQNRKGKRNIRVAASRRWYYSLSDWKSYEEIEDLEEREKNYFDQQLTTETNTEEAEEEVEVPSVPADPYITDECCEVCKDKFDQFFNEEKEEWHLKNAIRIEAKTYHPVCYEDYLEPSFNESKVEEPLEAKVEEKGIPGLEIVLDDDADEDEVIIAEDEKEPEVEMKEEEKKEEEGDDDDVILNEVAPVKIVVDDDDDDDYDRNIVEDENSMDIKPKTERREEDDGFVDVQEGLISLQNGCQIKIKSEPIDPDYGDVEVEEPAEEPVEEVQKEPEEEIVKDHSQPAIISSIDGNVELSSGAPPAATTGIPGKIKINISKPLPVIAPKESKNPPAEPEPTETLVDPSQPLPPGEEPVLRLKPALQGLDLKKQPMVSKGAELTGLCSIM